MSEIEPKKNWSREPTKAGLAFGQRLTQACDNNPRVPELSKGRYTWIEREIRILDPDVFRGKKSTETIRKWFWGYSMPREAGIRALAQILGVSASWLAIGDQTAPTVKEARIRDAAVDGAVNLVMGALQMAGLSVAFPSKADDGESAIDIMMIANGASYRLSIVTAQRRGTEWVFPIPRASLSNSIRIIGVVPLSDVAFDFIDLRYGEVEEVGTRSRTATIDVVVGSDYRSGEHQWKQISSFRGTF